MKTTPSTMKADFEEQFGKLNAKQLWLVTKLAKYVRLRARNNAASELIRDGDKPESMQSHKMKD